MSTKQCPHCAAKLAEEDFFCEKCGTRYPADAPEIGSSQTEAAEVPASLAGTEPCATVEPPVFFPITESSAFPATDLPENTDYPASVDLSAVPPEKDPKKKKRLIILISAAVGVLGIIGVIVAVVLTGRYDPDKLLGTWYMDDKNFFSFTLYENGSGKIVISIDDDISDEPFVNAWPDDNMSLPLTWRTSENILTVNLSLLLYSYSIDFEYEFKGNKLYLTPLSEDGEKKETMVFRKKKSSDKDSKSDKDISSDILPEIPGTKEKNYADSVKIVDEYWGSSYNSWSKTTNCFHYVIVKNKSETPLSVSTSSLAYDAIGNLLGSANGGAVIVPAGETSFIEEEFSFAGTINADYFKSTVKATEASISKAVLKNLKVTDTKSSNGTVLILSNTGKEEIDSIHGLVCFYKGGKFMDFKTVNVYSLESGDSVYEQVDCKTDFDTYEYYFNASNYSW